VARSSIAREEPGIPAVSDKPPRGHNLLADGFQYALDIHRVNNGEVFQVGPGPAGDDTQPLRTGNLPELLFEGETEGSLVMEELPPVRGTLACGRPDRGKAVLHRLLPGAPIPRSVVA
jgi:hypothetical protein